MIEFLKMFFLLMCGHAIADYGLQTSFVGKYKYRKYAHELPKEQKLNEVWPWVLSGHALIHGFFTYAITGIFWFGLFETLVHGLIDFLKCEGKLDVHQDQWLHVICKLIYALILVSIT